MPLKELYEKDIDFKTYVDKFVIFQRNKGNYISPEQAMEYSMVGEYAACLNIKRKGKG